MLSEPRRRLVIVAAALALLMLLFPPWYQEGRYTGHSPILVPKRGPVKLPNLWSFGSPPPPRVYWEFLAVEYRALIVCTGALFLLLPGEPRRHQVAGTNSLRPRRG